MKWLIARLNEASSWRGIIWLITACGLTLKPEQADAIIVAGVALAGLFGVFTEDESLPPIELQSKSESITPLPPRVQSDVQTESKTDSGWNG